MSDALPTSPVLPAAREATILLDPDEVLTCVAEPTRRRILDALSRDGALSITDLAERLGKEPDLIAKHLRVMRAARVVMPANQPGQDGRKLFHAVPAPFVSRDAEGRRVLDFGAVALRFS